MPPIVIVDTQVICHKIHHALQGLSVDLDTRKSLIKAQLAYVHSGAWCSEVIGPTRTLWVNDYKDESRMYWRHHYLRQQAIASAIPRKTKGRPSEAKRQRFLALRDTLGVQGLDDVIERYHEHIDDLGSAGIVCNGSLKDLKELVALGAALRVAYKGGRSQPDYLMQVIRKVVLETLGIWGALDKKGYEADDMAALVVRLAPVDQDLVLLTVDTDWLALCSDRVTWVCATGYAPRVRHMSDGSLNSWAEKRLGVTLETPREIWDIKVIQGDASDKLPPGSPLGVIDLMQPVPEHDLMNDSALVARATRMLSDAPVSPMASKVPQALAFIKGHGVALCVPALAADQLYTRDYGYHRELDSTAA